MSRKLSYLAIIVLALSARKTLKNVMLTLKSNCVKQCKSAATMAVKVIQGTALGKIAVQHSTQIDLEINLEAASRLGMAVPFKILSAATEVIK